MNEKEKDDIIKGIKYFILLLFGVLLLALIDMVFGFPVAKNWIRVVSG